MGYQEEEVTVKCRLSRHNSERDAMNDEAWEDFQVELKALVDAYQEIELRIV